MRTPAAWEAVSRGTEGKQPEMKYLLQRFEQDCLGGGGAMWMPGRGSREGGAPHLLQPFLLCARQSANCMHLLIYSPQNCFRLRVIIIHVLHSFLHPFSQHVSLNTFSDVKTESKRWKNCGGSQSLYPVLFAPFSAEIKCTTEDSKGENSFVS